MVTELALKMKVGVQLSRDPEAQVTFSNRVLMKMQTIAMALVTTIYLGFTAYEVHLSTQPIETWFGPFSSGIGISFLVAFVLLGVVNAYLAV